MLQFSIFIAVTASCLTLLLALGGLWHPGRNRIRRRLAGEFGSGAGSAPSPLYKDLLALDTGSLEKPESESDTIARPAHRSPRWRWWLEELIRRAGLNWTVRQVLGMAAASSLVAGGLGLGLFGWIAGIGGGVAGALLVLVFLSARGKMRRERYLTQLLGAFELMARVLRAGQSVPESFRAAVEAFDEPLKSEFEFCLHQIEHGLRPETAFRELSQRSGILELRIFVVTMTIQRQSGGNLSEILDRLASVVRSRMRVRQKIRALTAEGRLQSLTLVVLPVITFAFMYFLNRQYAQSLLEHGQLLAATVGLMVIGIVWIRNIMSFEG